MNSRLGANLRFLMKKCVYSFGRHFCGLYQPSKTFDPNFFLQKWKWCHRGETIGRFNPCRPYNPYGFTNHWTLNQITYSCYSTFGCFSEIATLIKSVAALKCVPQAFSSRKSKTNLWHLQSLQLMQFVYSHTY